MLLLQFIHLSLRSLGAGDFLPAEASMWNDLPTPKFDSGTFNEFIRGWLLTSLRFFSNFQWHMCLCGCFSYFINILLFQCWLQLLNLIIIIKLNENDKAS